MSADVAVVEGFSLRGTLETPTSRKSGTLETPTFSMIPESVLVDPALKNIDIRVFGLLACARRKQFTSVGERLLANRLNVDRRTIRASITRLIASPHLNLTEPTRYGRRARYELTSPIFAGKSKAPAPEKPGSSRGQSLGKPSVVCPRCHKLRGGLLKTGWCRSCHMDIKLDRKIELKFIERDKRERQRATA